MIVFNKFVLTFFVLNVYAVYVCGEDLKEDSIDKGAHSDRNGLWFGPRLGKRSLNIANEDDRQPFLSLLEAADALKTYYNQLELEQGGSTKQNRLPYCAPQYRKSTSETLPTRRSYRNHKVVFTPRLGREIDDDQPTDQEIADMAVKSVGLSTYYGPGIHFTPRLGREVSDFYRPSLRIARSVNKTKPS